VARHGTEKGECMQYIDVCLRLEVLCHIVGIVVVMSSISINLEACDEQTCPETI
jgi:hypothetical protein